MKRKLFIFGKKKQSKKKISTCFHIYLWYKLTHGKRGEPMSYLLHWKVIWGLYLIVFQLSYLFKFANTIILVLCYAMLSHFSRVQLLWPHRRQPTRLPHPWDSPGKNTGVGCHFLLQSMKVKSESEVVQSCLTLSNPMDCSLPGSSVHGIFQARVLEWGTIAFSTSWFYPMLIWGYRDVWESSVTF